MEDQKPFHEYVPVVRWKVARRREITSDRPRGALCWQPDGRGGIFVTCPHCEKICKVDEAVARHDGLTFGCTVCPNERCESHFWIILEDWDGPVFCTCARCGRSATGAHGRLPEGWKKIKNPPHPECDCEKCKGSYCPYCKEF